MVRTRTTTLVLLLAPLVVLFVSACGGSGQEQTLIRTYFQAARVGDRASLGNIAMFDWNTRENGSVSRPDVVSVGEEQRRPLRIKELSQALMEAREAEATFTEEKIAYQDENFEAINRVIEAEREGNDVASRDTELQAAWTEWRDRTMEHSKMVSDAQQELAAEQGEARLSMDDPNNPLDLTQYNGELLTKDVEITATVDLDGDSSEQAMTVTLQKAILTADDGTVIEGRWVVRNIIRN